jgi:hypothetical protein
LKVPLTGFDHHDTFYAKSLVVKNAEPLTREELSSFWTFVINEGKTNGFGWFSIINLYGGAGSVINVPQKGEAALADSRLVFDKHDKSN